MAIVGTAYVATKVISDNLSKDIKKSVQKGLDDAAPDIQKSTQKMGDDMGKSISDSMGKRVDNDLKRKVRPKFTDFGKNLAREMKDVGDRVGSALGRALLSRMGILLAVLTPLIISAIQVLGAYVSQATALILPLLQSIGAAGGIAATGIFALGAAGATLFAAFKTETPVLERFKEVVSSIGSEFRQVGEAVQQELLPNLAIAFDQITALIPMLTERLAEMGAVIGEVALDVADLVTSSEKMAQLDAAFSSSTTIVESLGGAFTNLVDAFISIAAAAAPLTERFAEWVRLLTEGWAASLNAASATGELTEWFDRAGDVAAQLGEIFGNVFGALSNIFKAGAEESQNLLDRMTEVTARWEEWTGSIAGQNRLQEWFADGSAIAQEFNGLLGDIFRMFGRLMMMDEGGALGLIGALRDLVPVIEDMLPSMVQLTQVFGEFLTKMSESGALGLLVGVFIAFFEVLSALLSIPGLGQFVGLLLGLLPVVAIISKIVSALSALAPVISAIVVAVKVLVASIAILLGVSIGWAIAIVAAIAAVIAAVVWLWQNWDQVTQWLTQAWQWVVDGIQAGWDWIKGVWDAMVGALQGVFDWFVSIFTGIADFIAGIVATIIEFFQPLIDFFTKGVEVFLNVLRSIWQIFFTWILLPPRIAIGLIIAIWQFLFDKAREIIGAIVNWVRDTWATIKEFFEKPIRDAKEGIAKLWFQLKKLFEAGINYVRDWVSDKWNALKERLEEPIRKAKEGLQRIMDNIKDLFRRGFDSVKGIVDGVAGTIKSVINGIIGGINAVIRGMNTLIRGANKLPGPDLPTIPEVPKLARGGVVSPTGGGTLALIAEAGRPERVEPLDDQGLSKRDRALIATLGGSGATEVRVYIGDKELTDMIRVEQYRREDEVSRQLVGGVY